MSLVDFMLNLAALLLWLNWRAIPFNPAVSPSSSGALLSTIRKAGPSNRTLVFLVGCGLVVVLRAILYWQIGSQLNWHPSIPLVLINPVFRSDYFGRILLFSVLSFVLTIALFYHSLLFLSVVNHRLPDSDPIQHWIRQHLGWVEHLPVPVRLLVPFLVSMAGWCVLGPVLAAMHNYPSAGSLGHLLQQGVLLGTISYLAWKYLIIAILVLHLVNSYVYLGAMTFWTYLHHTSRAILWPISWLPLQIGRLDFSPVVMMALVFLLSEVPNLEWVQRAVAPLLY